jgi:hypothetical protein
MPFMTKAEEPIPLKPEAELVGVVDQQDTARTDEDVEGTALAFEEQAEANAALERQLEGTFPTSDPSSSWAGPDIEPERARDTEHDDQNEAEVLHEDVGPSSLNLSPLGVDEGSEPAAEDTPELG